MGDERNKKVFTDYVQGMSIDLIAQSNHITRQRVYQIVKEEVIKLHDSDRKLQDCRELIKSQQKQISQLEELKAQEFAEYELDRQGVGSLSIWSLAVSVRAANVFKNIGIETVGELLNYSASDLLKVPNFGRKTLNEINKELGELGVSLKSRFPTKKEVSIDPYHYYKQKEK